jgi:hypothetical protein
MPIVAYVHAHDSDGERRAPWEPNWRVWRWVVAAVPLAYAASRTEGALGLLLVLIVFALACRAATEALPSGDGLREWRQ